MNMNPTASVSRFAAIVTVLISAWLAGCQGPAGGRAAKAPTSPANAAAVQVPVWYGSGAVLARAVDYPSTNRVLVAGEAAAKLELEARLVGGPDDGIYIDFRQWQKGPWRPWSLLLVRMTDAQEEHIAPGRPFQLELAPKKKPFPPLLLTNLVVGPLYAVHVDPKRDSHEMPDVSPEVLRRVRLLILSHDLDPDTGMGWVSASEALERRLPEFCGMPRAFAERLVQAHPEEIGMVIIRDDRPMATSKSSAAVQAVVGVDRSRYPAPLTAASELVWDAVTGKTAPFDRISAYARYDRRLASDIRKAQEARYEGKTTEIHDTLYRWTRIADGAHSRLPFAVTAEIW
jgi:hypothetical protein